MTGQTMNERIRELAEQAEDWADSQNFYESDYRDYLMEKFAELIVREVLDVQKRLISQGHDQVNHTAWHLLDATIKHFGTKL